MASCENESLARRLSDSVSKCRTVNTLVFSVAERNMAVRCEHNLFGCKGGVPNPNMLPPIPIMDGR